MQERKFAHEHKSHASYLDIAANSHGDEKGLLLHRALRRTQRERPHAVEVGPGGGAAVSYLASELTSAELEALRLTLIEAPGIVSQSLSDAVGQLRKAGVSCEVAEGFAQDIKHIVPGPVDVVSASALLHEVYSYGGGYGNLHAMMRELPTVLHPYGFFVYRDVYAVESPTLHERVIQSYDSVAWLQFIRMFVPQYLRDGRHPYHHASDDILARQDSRVVPIGELDVNTCLFVVAPVGLFREIQRHYITFRDHVWRSGVLGFKPILEGQFAHDWVDFRRGHKRAHYTLTDADRLLTSQRSSLLAMSESYADHYTIDSDILDEVTDVALTAFLVAAEQGDEACCDVWSSWLTREGRETYAYMTIDELLTAFAVNSAESCETALLPVEVGDVLRTDRNYYNRFLTKRLANPLRDAKQLVLFQNVPLSDELTLRRALETVQRFCTKYNLARAYKAVNSTWR